MQRDVLPYVLVASLAHDLGDPEDLVVLTAFGKGLPNARVGHRRVPIEIRDGVGALEVHADVAHPQSVADGGSVDTISLSKLRNKRFSSTDALLFELVAGTFTQCDPFGGKHRSGR